MYVNVDYTDGMTTMVRLSDGTQRVLTCLKNMLEIMINEE